MTFRFPEAAIPHRVLATQSGSTGYRNPRRKAARRPCELRGLASQACDHFARCSKAPEKTTNATQATVNATVLATRRPKPLM